MQNFCLRSKKQEAFRISYAKFQDKVEKDILDAYKTFFSINDVELNERRLRSLADAFLDHTNEFIRGEKTELCYVSRNNIIVNATKDYRDLQQLKTFLKEKENFYDIIDYEGYIVPADDLITLLNMLNVVFID